MIQIEKHTRVVYTQDAVSNGGPLLAIVGFVVLPIIWSVPEAMVTAELATAFPENSGYVAWVTAAFGPFWGFQVCCQTSLPIVESSIFHFLAGAGRTRRSPDTCFSNYPTI